MRLRLFALLTMGLLAGVTTAWAAGVRLPTGAAETARPAICSDSGCPCEPCPACGECCPLCCPHGH
jgi:hypothetical protein